MTDPRPGAVLFVDDEPLLLQGLQRMLRSQREVWAMRFAGSGREALALLQQQRPSPLGHGRHGAELTQLRRLDEDRLQPGHPRCLARSSMVRSWSL